MSLDFARLKELRDKATPGPWHIEGDLGDGKLGGLYDEESDPINWGDGDGYGCLKIEDAKLIVAMRNSLDDLIAAAERVEKLETVRGWFVQAIELWRDSPSDLGPLLEAKAAALEEAKG